MRNAAPRETPDCAADAAAGWRVIGGMTSSLTQSKMHAVPPTASEQPVLPRRSALVIEILAFVLIAFLVVSALLFNLTAPRSLVASQSAVSVQLPPVTASGPSPATPRGHPITQAAPAGATVALTDVQPQAGVEPTPPIDTGAAAAALEPQIEVAALPPADTPVVSGVVSKPTPPPISDEETTSVAMPAEEVDALLRRGDELLGTGDIVAARAAYERAAAGGNRTAAIGVAKTYDPIFLSQSGVRGLRGDPARAALWYARAAAAGDRTAQQRLRQLRAQYPQ